MRGLTRELAELIVSAQYSSLPPRCLHAVRLGFTDCIGVTIAGSTEDVSRIARSLTAEIQAPNFALEIPSGRKLSALDAALVNGVAAHALDYDDVSLAGHPSAVLVPAILAAGSEINVNGRQAATAYAVGFEVWARLEALNPGRLHGRGFHPTAVFGCLAAAAAAAHLYRLSPEKAICALGLAASFAAGLVANFGTMTKPLHAGRAAQSGLYAVMLAGRGFTAASDALEHPAGFLQAHGVFNEPNVASSETRSPNDEPRWALADRGLDIKRYPTCYATHRAIDAAIEITEHDNLKIEAIERIVVSTGSEQMRILRYMLPQNALEAKFSMTFAVTAGLLARRVGLAELQDEFVRRPEVQSIMQKVRCTTTDMRMVGDELFAPSDQVDVILSNGVSMSPPPITHALGSWRNPMKAEDLRSKFMDCVAPHLATSIAKTLFEQLTHFDELASLRKIIFSPEEKAVKPFIS